MKRFMISVAALLGLVAFCHGTAQAAVQYQLEEVGISIELPKDYIVITRDTPADDSAYDVFGVDGESASDLFEQNHSYLDAMEPHYENEISVTMLQTQGVKDFSWVDETVLEAYEDMLRTQAETAGSTYVSSEVYRNQQATFIKLYTDITVGETVCHGMSYYTAYDGRTINVNFFSYQGELTREDETLLQGVVDSVRFGTVTDQGEWAESWEYTDLETGLSFTMPDGWVRQEMMETDENISMVAACQREPGLVLQYSGMDVWSAMSSSERVGLERWDVDQSFLSQRVIAEIYQIDASEVSTVTYGGKEYYMARVDLGTLVGMDVGEYMERTLLARVENGYMYQFFYSARFADPQFQELKAILDSAHYPELEVPTPTPVPSVAPSAPPAYNYTRDTGRGETNTEEQFVWAVIAFAVIGVASLLLWDWHRRRAARKAAAPTPTYSFVPAQDLSAQVPAAEQTTPVEAPDAPAPAPSAQTPEKPQEGGCCPTCGAPVPPGVRFCHRCGSRLQSEEQKGESEG